MKDKRLKRKLNIKY